MDEYQDVQAHWQGLPLWTMTSEPVGDSLSDLHQRPTPPAPSSFSSLNTALDISPPQPVQTRPLNRSSPPPEYNPYPYAETYLLDHKLTPSQCHLWHHREDNWMKYSDGDYVLEVRERVCGLYINGVRNRQFAARKEWEDTRLLQQAPPQTSVADSEEVDHSLDFQFVTSREEKGIPVKTLMSGRRAIEGVLMSPKGKVFENYPHDTLQVRIKWPAYPDHEPIRTIVVTMRAGRKISRRPCTNLEFAVALAGLVTRYYSEVSRLQPHPAFTHLALGAGEGRISLYALRMVGIRAAPKGIFDLELELDGTQPSTPDNSTVEGSTTCTAPMPVSTEAESEPYAVEDKAKPAPWAQTLPVVCTIASPPKISVAQYYTHVDPIILEKVPLPVWPEKQ